MAERYYNMPIKQGTISGTTAASGWLVTNISSSYKIISAYASDSNSAVIAGLIGSEWWFLVCGVDNNYMKGKGNTQVTIKYYYL